MGAETQAWVQLVTQAVEAVVWLVLTAWCLERLRTQAWARFAAPGAVLMLIPAMTLTAARAQLQLGDQSTILGNYALSGLPATYAVMRVAALGLLLAAVVVGRGTGRTSAA